MCLLLAQRQNLGIKNHHEFNPLQQNHIPHNRNLSPAGNSHSGRLKRMGRGTLCLRACSWRWAALPGAVGRDWEEKLREQPFQNLEDRDLWAPLAFSASSQRSLSRGLWVGTSQVGGCAILTRCVALCFSFVQPEHPLRSLQSSPVRSFVPWAEWRLTSPLVPSFPRAFLLPSPFTIPKVWGKESSSCY